LTDLHMPGMDGYALVRQIREAEALAAAEGRPARVPILALTANALKGEEAHALRTGMDAYLTKPISLDALRSALAQWRGPGSDRAAAAPESLPVASPKRDQAALDL
jgi:CheY-like chemotaxis protein